MRGHSRSDERRGVRLTPASARTASQSPPRGSRAALLAGASLAALAAVGPPGAAQAACAGPDQTISASTTGPIFSNGGAITISPNVAVTGGSEGVYAQNCGITTLSNSGL